jgi:NADH-quinone oxidoreductase subunit F
MHPLEKRILLPDDLKPINTLEEYKARGGLKGLERARSMTPIDVIKEVKKANLRGRGGAGFPTALKWETVFKDSSPKKYVVCNGAEGEPGTYKDRYTIMKNPYQLLEGLLIVAYVINANEAIIGTKKKFTPQVNRLQKAIEEFENAGLAQKGYIRLVLGPDDYLFGEEKALLEVVDGRDPMPRMYPPYLIGVGYNNSAEGYPTVVNNMESLSQLSHILAKGADWFRTTGTEDTPGTVTLTLSGDIKRPGMYEVPTGLTVNQMLYDLGGGPKADKPFMAIYSGVANRVMTPDLFDLKMDFGTLRGKGVGLGSAGFIVYDESHCIVNICRMLSRFLALSSCGQCVPCNKGTRDITEYLDKLEEGKGSMDDIDAIIDVTGRCTNQTRCFLPTQESVLVSSTIAKFRKQFEYHALHGCNFQPEELIVPKIESFDETTGQFVYEKPKPVYGLVQPT